MDCSFRLRHVKQLVLRLTRSGEASNVNMAGFEFERRIFLYLDDGIEARSIAHLSQLVPIIHRASQGFKGTVRRPLCYRSSLKCGIGTKVMIRIQSPINQRYTSLSALCAFRL